MNHSFKESFKISELIAKYLLETATEEEKKYLQKWLQDSPNNQKEYDSIMERLRTDLLSDDPVNAHQAWKDFEDKLPVSGRRKFMIRRWSKYASIVILILFSVWMSIWYFIPSLDNEQLSMIVPGSAKAILQTSDGEGVEIFPEIEEIEDRMGNYILRNEHGVLRYDMTSRMDSIRSFYHTLTIPRGGEYTIVLADGTKIYLNSESTLKYPVVFSPSDTVRKVFVSGEAYFQVAKNEQLPFEVHMSNGIIKVYGTKFNVHDYADEDMTIVTLSDGNIGYEIGKDEYKLMPGEQVVYNRSVNKIEKSKVDASMYTSWIDGVFEFNSMPLKRIMKQLARWYDVDYRFENKELEEHLFTGIAYKHAPLSELLKQIEKTTRIRFSIQERTIIISN